MGFDPNTTKPEIDFPGDSAPSELVIEDLKEGDGPQAAAGNTTSASCAVSVMKMSCTTRKSLS